MKDTKVLKPKSRGAGIMVSDFIDERNGYLHLTEESTKKELETDSNAKLVAREFREFLEYCQAREGYWTSDKFMHQIEKAYKIAEIKYSSSNGWKHVWIFDHSSFYAAMPHDALDINALKVNPSGKQRVMRATGILSLITIAIKTSIKIHLRLLCKKLEVHVKVDNVHIHVRNLKSGCIVFVLQFIL